MANKPQKQTDSIESHDSAHCYHCGLPVDEATHEQLAVLGAQRDFCCHGCKSVCKTIVDAGLEDYYRNRDLGVSSNQQKDLDELLDKLSIYDNEQVQKSFVHGEANWQEAYLILEGIRCSACVWLNELHLRQQPGVLDVHIDDVTQRARVRWDPEQIVLSQILAAIVSIGYQAHPYEPSHYLELQKANKRKNLHRLLFAAIIGMLPMHFALASWFLGGPDEHGELEQWEQIGRWTNLFVTLTILLYPAQEFFYGAWSDLKRKIIGMDVPIVLGLSCAFLLSVYSTYRGSGEVYYESIAMFVLFILISRKLEHQAKIKASDQLERLALSQPLDARRVQQDGQLQTVSVLDLQPGHIIQILPGEQVPVDSIIIEGKSSFNEALITGESRAIDHGVGDTLMAGSVNYDQPVLARVESGEMESTIAEITRLAESGLQHKPVQALLADKVATRFVIFILLVAFSTAMFWLYQGNHEWLVITVSVLIVTCPCALALAVPIALTVSSSRYLAMGVMARDMSKINRLNKVDLFVFDKTGTLTVGKPQLVDSFWAKDVDKRLAQSVLLGLVSHSEHPVAKSMLQHYSEGEAEPVEHIVNYAGQGIAGEFAGYWRLGRYEFIREHLGKVPAELEARFSEAMQQHFSISCLSRDDQLVAIFLFEDRLREGNEKVVRQLNQQGIECVILSGDTQKSVAQVAAKLHIGNFRGGMSPQQKMDWVKHQQNDGKVVAMIGDGINDAPTLASADISFSLSESTALANDNSDFLILGSKLKVIPEAVALARKTLSRIRQNIAWAILYNLIAIPFAVAGWVPPWAAAIGMSASSAIVVLNSMRFDRRSVERNQATREIRV